MESNILRVTQQIQSQHLQSQQAILALQQPTMYQQTFLQQQSSYPVTYTGQQPILHSRADNSAFFAFLAHLNDPLKQSFR